MAEDKLYPIKRAAYLAGEVVDLIGPACKQVSIAGSIRRGKKQHY